MGCESDLNPGYGSMYLHHSAVHSGAVAGIYGTAETGCFSVVLSGGYEDDVDEGDHL